jgi:hypothetical protein
VVTSLADSGAGTLRAAIAQANLDAANDTIDFAPSATGTISLSTALPNLSTNVTIAGPGASVLTVARSGSAGTPDFGVFTVSTGSEVAISGLTISGGSVGGILNQGTLTLTNSTVSGNDSLEGGGIYNRGTLTVTNSTVSTNHSYFSGGGILNQGTLTVTNSTLSGNTFGGFAHGLGPVAGGGGIANDGTLTLTNSSLSANTALAGAGGGILNDGTLTLTNSSLSGNSAGYGGGGGIFNQGSLTVTNCTLSGDSASNGGGGGGIFNSGEIGTATLTVTDSTLSGNSSDGEGGGIANSGTLTVTNCTLSGNSAGHGACIYNLRSLNTQATLIFENSIFANNTGGNLANDGARVNSAGHNLFSDNPRVRPASRQTRVSLDPTDKVNTDPLLGPLADNGGPTLTQALLPGSPAINAGVAVAGVTTDQRGVPRPQGRGPDIGAFELQVPPEVLGAQFHFVHDQPRTLAVTFTQPMDASSVEDLVDYRLVSAGRNGLFGPRDGRAIRIRSLNYDATSRTVTILPADRLPSRGRFQLTIIGTPTSGLKGSSGLFLDGAGNGQAGTNYVIVINDKLLPPPIIGHPGRRSSVSHRA